MLVTYNHIAPCGHNANYEYNRQILFRKRRPVQLRKGGDEDEDVGACHEVDSTSEVKEHDGPGEVLRKQWDINTTYDY